MSGLLMALVLVAGAATGPPTFPLTVKVAPGGLAVRIFDHTVPTRDGDIRCWSYVSQGLMDHGQREIVLTVRQRKGENAADYPTDPLKFLGTVLEYAKAGQLVEEGGRTDLAPQSHFLGRMEDTTLVYVEPSPLPGVDLPAGTLAAVALVGDEGPMGAQFGYWRVLARLAFATRQYPTPTWIDRDRPPVVALSEVADSPLRLMSRVHVPGTSVVREGGTVTLRIRPHARKDVAEAMARLKQDALVMFTGFDTAANAMLVWRPQAGRLEAVSPDGSDGSRMAGTFIGLVGGIKEPAMRIMESGFTFLLSAADWAQVKDALANAKPLNLPNAGGAGAGLSIEWPTDTYTSADGRTWQAPSGFDLFKPSAGAPHPPTAPVDIERIVLLTPDAAIRSAGLDAAVLARYTRALNEAAARHGGLAKASGLLAVMVTLRPDGPAIVLAAREGLAEPALAGLQKELATVEAPQARAEVTFELLLRVHPRP